MPTHKRDEWPSWAQNHYPEPGDKRPWAAMEWHYPLHQFVLVVAHTRIEGAWCAYCAPVPGMRHDREHEPVLLHGDLVSEQIARVMFPHMDDIPYAT